MFHLIGRIVEFAFQAVGFAIEMFFSVFSLALNILGTLFSVFLGLGALGLIAALIFIVRRGKRKTSTEPQQRVYDVDGEEFTSFYDQFRE